MIPIAQKNDFQLAVQDSELPREDPSFSPVMLLSAIRRRIWLALGIGVILAIVTGPAIWAFLPPPKPRVSTQLYMDNRELGILNRHPDDPLNHMSQIALIKSDKVLSVALLKPEVAQLPLVRSQADPIDWLSKNLQVDFPYGGEVLRISISDTNTDDAIKVVNEVKLAYLDEVTGASKRARQERKERLSTLKNVAKANLDRKQAFVEKYSESFGSIDPMNVATQQRMALEQLGLARKELGIAESNLRRLIIEDKANSGTQLLPRAPTNDEILAHVEASEEVMSIAQQQKEANDTIKKLEKDGVLEFVAARPDYLKAKQELPKLEEKLKAAREKARTEYLSYVRTKFLIESQSRREQASGLIKYQTEVRDLIAKEVERFEQSIKKQNTDNTRIEAERIELKLSEDLYTRVATAIATMETEVDQPPRVRPLDDSASVERVDLTTRKIQFSVGGAVAAFLLGCGVVGFFEHRTRRLDSVEAIGASCGVTILGTVPRFPSSNWRALGAASVRWQTALAESVDCTRTFLLHGPGLSGIRSVLITSAESGEGKSSFAAQLAVSFARGGMRTLLVDGDLRKPGVSMLVGVENGEGLAELLRGEVVLPDVLRTSRIPGLSVISAGRCDDYALAALAQDRNTIRSLQTLYDMVIVDSAPILPVTDPLHLARQVDGVILATLQDFSRAPLVREAGDRLRRLGIRIIGAIVNGTPNRVYGYGYHYQSTGPAIAAGSDANATTAN